MGLYAQYTRFTCKPGKAPMLVGILTKANGIVSTAAGCRLYIINRDAGKEDTIWVTELWDSAEDHAMSLTMDGCKELITEAMPLLASPPDPIVLEALAGKGTEDGSF